MTNEELSAKLLAALEQLPDVYHLRHFASYTIDYERRCLTGHYYRLQYRPGFDDVICLT